MTVITPAPNPKALINPSLLSPAFNNSVWLASSFRQLLSITTIFLFFRAYILSLLILQNSFYASQLLLVNTYYTASVLARNAFKASKQIATVGWKGTEKARDKMFFEFMIFVLGGGNGLILVVFWPGWIVLGGGAWGMWWICG